MSLRASAALPRCGCGHGLLFCGVAGTDQVLCENMGVEEAAVGGGEVEGYGPHGREDGREPQQEQLHLLPHTITPSVSAHRVLIRLGTGLEETGLFAAAGSNRASQSIASNRASRRVNEEDFLLA